MQYAIHRTGQATLLVEGEILATATSPQFKRHLLKPGDRNRWFEAAIYSTTTGHYVVQLGYRFSGSLFRERPRDVALIRDTVELAVLSLAAYECTLMVAGYPNLPEYEQKQRDLERRVKEDFESLVVDIENQIAALAEPERLS